MLILNTKWHCPFVTLRSLATRSSVSSHVGDVRSALAGLFVVSEANGFSSAGKGGAWNSGGTGGGGSPCQVALHVPAPLPALALALVA